ncbi:hypothetical protein NDU88_001361 [Pleurodeles waltl]|uniref:Uncharacterized protein n=1 Tax=Pleurodeles waltl TaxID=8319 RepID=A0AAV7P3K2_PLEWA|nr:hypothetical protein NDU88_001361 [Pleurodeles waltl]
MAWRTTRFRFVVEASSLSLISKHIGPHAELTRLSIPQNSITSERSRSADVAPPLRSTARAQTVARSDAASIPGACHNSGERISIRRTDILKQD